MSSNASRRGEWYIAERFRCSSAGDFEWIDRCRELLAGVGHFVRVGDAYHTLAVFVELGHFRNFGRGNGNEVLEDAGVEFMDVLEGVRCQII
jgi:hypothetical protein